MKRIIPNNIYLAFTMAVLACFTLILAPKAFGVSPAPDGGYPNYNTAEGDNALTGLTTGAQNTAIGWGALYSNSTGDANTASGLQALHSNTFGGGNTANGAATLYNNTFGSYNTAIGQGALYNTTGSSNIALGGLNAGYNLTTGNNNIDIGNRGVAGESNTIRIGGDNGAGYGSQTATFIAGINGVSVTNGNPVVINANGQLGTIPLSSLQGATGPAGPTGPIGPAGATGATGATEIGRAHV